jgi:hypothetical protein
MEVGKSQSESELSDFYAILCLLQEFLFKLL